MSDIYLFKYQREDYDPEFYEFTAEEYAWMQQQTQVFPDSFYEILEAADDDELKEMNLADVDIRDRSTASDAIAAATANSAMEYPSFYDNFIDELVSYQPRTKLPVSNLHELFQWVQGNGHTVVGVSEATYFRE